MCIIELEGLHFYAYHGYYELERIIGNEFVVNVTIETDNTLAGNTDQLEDALNYQQVYDIVKYEMEIKSNLLEHVAKRIIDSLWKSFPGSESIMVKVTKLNPPMGGEVEKASVTMKLKK